MKENDVVQTLSYEEFLSSEAKASSDPSPEKISKKKRKRHSHDRMPEKRTKPDMLSDLSPNAKIKEIRSNKNSDSGKKKSIDKYFGTKKSSDSKPPKLYNIFTKQNKSEKSRSKNGEVDKKPTELQNDSIVDLTSPDLVRKSVSQSDCISPASEKKIKNCLKNGDLTSPKEINTSQMSEEQANMMDPPPSKRKKSEKMVEKSSDTSKSRPKRSSCGSLKTADDVFNSPTTKSSAIKLSAKGVGTKTAKQTKLFNSPAKKQKQLKLPGSRNATKQTKIIESVKTKRKTDEKVIESRRKSSSDGVVFVAEVTPRHDSPMKPVVFGRSRNAVCDLPALENETMTWSEKYEPKCADEVVGNSVNLEKLSNWLKEWKKRWEKEKEELEKQEKLGKNENIEDDSDSDFDLDEEDKVKLKQEEDTFSRCAVIIGPYGCGKTASVYACAKEMNFKVFEMNASSLRSSKQVLSQLHEATQSHQVSKAKQSFNFFAVKNEIKKPMQNSLILFEDVDVLFDEDKFFWSGVQTLISETKRPIILTTSDGGVLRNLDQKFERFLFGPPAVTRQLSRLKSVAEGEHFIIPENLFADVKMANQLLFCDLRKTIHHLHFWCSNIGVKVSEAAKTKSTSKGKARKRRRSSRGRLKFDEKDNADKEALEAPKQHTEICHFLAKISGVHDLLFQVEKTDRNVQEVVGLSPLSSTNQKSDLHHLCSLLLNSGSLELSQIESAISTMLTSQLPQIILLNWLTLLPSCGGFDPQFSVGKSSLLIHVPPTYAARDIEMEFSSYDFTMEESFTPCVQEPMDFLIDEDSVDRCYPSQTGINQYFPTQHSMNQMHLVQSGFNQYYPLHPGPNQYFPAQHGFSQIYPVQPSQNLQQFPVQPGFSHMNPAQSSYIQYPPVQTAVTPQMPLHQTYSTQVPPRNPHLVPICYPPHGSPCKAFPVQAGHIQPYAATTGPNQCSVTPNNQNPYYPTLNQSYPVSAGPNQPYSVPASPNQPYPIPSGSNQPYPVPGGLNQQYQVQTGPSHAFPISTGLNPYHPPSNHPYPVSTGFNVQPVPNQPYPVQAGPNQSYPAVTSYATRPSTPYRSAQISSNQCHPATTAYNPHPCYPPHTGSSQYQPLSTSDNFTSVPHQTGINQINAIVTTTYPTQGNARMLNSNETISNLSQPVKTNCSSLPPAQTNSQSSKSTQASSSKSQPVRTSSGQKNTTHITLCSNSQPKSLKLNTKSKYEIKTLEAISSMADICCFTDYIQTSIAKVKKCQKTVKSNLDDTRCKLKDGLLDFLPKISEISHQVSATASDIQAAIQVRAMSQCCQDMQKVYLSLSHLESTSLNNGADTKGAKTESVVESSVQQHGSPANNTGLKESCSSTAEGTVSRTNLDLSVDDGTKSADLIENHKKSDSLEPCENNSSIIESRVIKSAMKLSVPETLYLRFPHEGKTRKNHQFMRHSLQSQFSGGLSVTTRAFIIDFLPAIRSICRSEDVRKDLKKRRRFMHYLNSIRVFPKSSEMTRLINDFKEVIIEK